MHYGGGDHYTADLGCIILQIKARGRGLGPQLVVCSPGLSVAHTKNATATAVQAYDLWCYTSVAL